MKLKMKWQEPLINFYRLVSEWLANSKKHQKKKSKKIDIFLLSHGADGRNRTGTGGKSRRILSPVRLPVPPHLHLFNWQKLLYYRFISNVNTLLKILEFF